MMIQTIIPPLPRRVSVPNRVFRIAPRKPDFQLPTEVIGPHPFETYVNPYLAKLLKSLRLDKRFVRGKGCELFDASGKDYLDCISAYGALPFGFNPPEIWDSLDEIRHGGEPSFVQPSMLDAAGELARRLLEIAPRNLQHVTFTNSGAESIEAAIKLCRVATGRTGILSAINSFHGKTMGALHATGNAHYQEGFVRASEDFSYIEFGDLDALKTALQARPDHYAAFVVEPIQGEGGIIVPPKGYLTQAKKLCAEAGVLFVLDEIQTGLGRTGSMFRCQEEGVEPDVMTLAKALGGGLMPIGAVLSSGNAFTEDFALKHSSTFAGNSLACRVGLATLDRLTRSGRYLIDRVALYGTRLKRRLRELQHNYPDLISEVRGDGFLLGISFSANRQVWPESLLGVAGEQEFFTPLFASCMLNMERVRVAPTLNGRAVIRIEPALIIRWRQCERLLASLERTLEVFSTGETGLVLEAILEGKRPRSMFIPVRKRAEWVDVRPKPQERRFGFLVHPLVTESLGDFDPSLKRLSRRNLGIFAENISGLIDPFVLNQARIKSKTGETIYGEFVTLPWTAEQMSKMRRKKAIERVREALHLARDRGAQMVGLGAFTSIATLGGKSVSNENVPVTSGNSYTAVASAESVRMALHQLETGTGRHVTAAIVGATGAIGRAMTLLMCEDVGTFYLVGNPESPPDQVRERLTHVATDLVQFARERPSDNPFPRGTIGAKIQSMSANDDQIVAQLERAGRLIITQDIRTSLRNANVVVTATNSTEPIVGPELRHRAIVCDLSRPENVSKEVAATRPDILVIDGGVIAAPPGSIIGEFGLGPNLIYACMAETMMLTLGGHLQNTSIGTDLCPKTLRLVRSLAETHGFRVAKLRSFGKPLREKKEG